MTNNECKCTKTKQRTDEERNKLINRLSRIEGQIKGIKRMVDKEAYCTDILIQSSAVTSAINSFNKELLSSHIHTCVVQDIKNNKLEIVEELVKIIQKLMK